MPFPGFHTGNSGRKRQLQDHRPSPLKVQRDSYMIKRVPATGQQELQPPPNRPPVIIYTVSPKVIHTKASDFMSLVQRLTGNGAVSGDNEVGRRDSVMENGIESTLEQSVSGNRILSPLPATLPPINSPSFFLPTPSSTMQSLFYELCPVVCGNSYLNSPTILLSSYVLGSPESCCDSFTPA